ncbi:phage tail tape measure protein [Leuconostoc pseudomesenteroides]|uniref:phage tail tape measure protein n=1 Tax=Leuconostoc pseudomesenteroides TaxID=33968 RepID=UPI001E47363F|nr:phage tail tape measure protein [Leuconostoc pseudomesenteroides]MCC7668945.1 phage tail tape measure protein [Leuconostoc pseudomesenteroides]
MAGEDIVANVRLNATEFYGTLRKMNSEINSNTREWKAQFSALSRSGDWVGAYQSKLKGLTDNYKIQTDKVKDLKSQMDAIGKPKTAEAAAELDKLGKELKTAESQAKLFGTQIKSTDLALKKAETGIHELAAEHKILSQITKANTEVFERQGLQYTANREKARGLISETQNLNKQYQAQQQYLNVLKNSYNSYSDEQKQTSTEARQLARDIKAQETAMLQTSSAIKNNQIEYKSLGKNISNVSQSVTLTADHMSNFGGKLIKSGQSLQQFGFYTQTVSTGLMSMFRQGAEGAAKLDQSLRETYNMLDKKPSGGINAFLKEYRDEITSLSKQWGVSQTDIADGMQEVIRAGYDEKSALDIASSSMKTSMATGEDYNAIMSGTTEILSQFGLKTNSATKNLENANRVQNALAKVANDTKTSYVGLSEAMSKVGPVAANMGYTVEQTASLIGYMANKGIDAEQAGNNLRMVFQRLSAPTKEAGGALKELGVSATDAQGNMKKLPEIMEQIDNATKNMGSSERQAYIKKIFGAYATTAATALLNGRSEIEKGAAAAGEAVSSGYTNALAKSNLKGADAQMKLFKAQWQALTIEFATNVMPTIIELMKTVGKLMGSFDNLNPSTKKLIAEFVAFGAIASPLVITLGGFASIAGTVFKLFGGAIPKVAGLASSMLTLKKATVMTQEVEAVGGALSRVTLHAGETSGAMSALGKGAGVAVVGMSGTALALTGVGVALAVAGTAAYLYVKHQQKMADAAQKTAEREKTYGYDVSKAVSDKLDVIKNHSFDTQYALQQLGDAKIDTSEIDKAKKAMEEFSDSVEQAYEKKNSGIDAKIKQIEELIGKTTGATKQALENEKAWLEGSKANNQQYIDDLNGNAKKRDEIFKQIADQGGKATKEQIKQLEEINKETVNSAIDAIKGLKEPVKKAIKDALNNTDVTKQSLTTLKQGFKEYNKIIGDSLADQINTTKESAKIIGKSTAWSDFFKNNAAALKPAADMMSAALKRVDKDTATGLPNQKAYSDTINTLKKSVEAAGMNWDEYRKHMGVATADQIRDMGVLYQYTERWNNQPVKESHVQNNGH